jgi:hypothetical protein
MLGCICLVPLCERRVVPAKSGVIGGSLGSRHKLSHLLRRKQIRTRRIGLAVTSSGEREQRERTDDEHVETDHHSHDGPTLLVTEVTLKTRCRGPRNRTGRITELGNDGGAARFGGR